MGKWSNLTSIFVQMGWLKPPKLSIFGEIVHFDHHLLQPGWNRNELSAICGSSSCLRMIFPPKVHGFVDFQCWFWSWCELFPRILGHSIQLWHPEEFFRWVWVCQWIRLLHRSISNQKTQLKSTLLRVFPKIWENPQIIHLFIGVFHYKPSILGYPYFWKHPWGSLFYIFYLGGHVMTFLLAIYFCLPLRGMRL